MELEAHDATADNLRGTRYKTSTFAPNPDKEDFELQDLQMECCDRIPHIDRPNFSIANIVEIIPRLLFNRHSLKLETSRSVKDEFAHTSTYLTASGEYAYISGLLMYEDLSQIYDAHQDMNYLKQRKKEKEEEMRNKNTMVSVGRGETESTKDNTFTTTYMVNKPKMDTLTSVAEEEMGASDHGNTLGSVLEEVQEIDHDADENSEEDKGDSDMDIKVPEKSDSTPMGLTAQKQDSLDHIKMYRHSLRKSESTKHDSVTRKRIKLPKVLVLVSKYPIYKDMEEFLRKIKSI